MNRSTLITQRNNGKRREKTNSAVLFAVRTFFLALVMALTMATVATTVSFNAYAADDEGKTVTVATFKQLQTALENTQGVSEIVIDPQAAVEEGEVTYAVEDDEESLAYYIGFDEPLNVPHKVKITSADDVDVYFARSDSFRRDQGKPALFNVDPTGALNLDGLITMTGEEVTTTFNEEDNSFLFSVKSKDGTGEDNEVWNRGQVLAGGFYIQNNGGYVKLGDDVILEEFFTEDDVEDVEAVFETESDNKLVSSKKGDNEIIDAFERTIDESIEIANGSKDEEVVEEEAVEEETAEEPKEEEKVEEEAPVVVAPKRSMKSFTTNSTQALNSTTPTPNGTNGIWYVSSWKEMKELLKKDKNSTVVNTIIITQDIVATPYESGTDHSIYLNGREVTIKGPDDKVVHIYRDENNANFPLFTVQNNNNKLTLGNNLVLSGKTSKCAKTLSEFASTQLPGRAEPEEHTGNATKAKFNSTEGYLANSSGYSLGLNGTGSDFDIDSNGKISTNIGDKPYWVYNFYFHDAADANKDVEIHDLDGNKVTSVVDGGTYIFYDRYWSAYIGWHTTNKQLWVKDANDVKFTKANALQFTASVVGGSGTGTYWTVPGQTTPKYTSATDQNLLNAMATYNAQHPVSGWIIDGTNYYDETSAASALKTYNTSLGLPEQGCDVKDKTWTSANFTSGTNINNPSAFFVRVQKKQTAGTLTIDGAVLENFVTDGSVKNAAPVTVTGGSTFEIKSGEIRNNIVGYGANEEAHSQATAQKLKNTHVVNSNRTDTAGAVIISGSGSTGKISGTAKINGNKADAGAMIVTDSAKVEMDMNTATDNNPIGIIGNVGWHHAGAVLVENGGTFHLKNGSINNNVAWLKGGAVWATEFGTSGLVEWDNYPNSMKAINENHYKKGGNFVMDGGELDGNFAFVRAGAIEVESNGVQLNSGTISNNMCKSLGGAIYVEGDSPIYTYTLKIKNGYIHHNTAVDSKKDDDLDKKLLNGKLVKGDDYANGTRHSDGDWSNWGMKQSGDGGGVWLCSMGGTSVFTSDESAGYKVVINNNKASSEYDSVADNGWGDDFYISRRYGSALVQNMLGDWVGDDGKDIVTFDANGRIIKGPKGMKNTSTDLTGGGIEIYGNKSRNGGGIAANGTIILGKTSDVYRYESELDITKGWDDDLAQNEVTIKLYYHVDADNNGKVDDGELFPLKNESNLDADGDTNDESKFYEIKLGGNNAAVVPTGNEVIYRTDKNSAKAFIPATVTHTDGSTKPLYSIKNNQGSNGHILGTDTSTKYIDTANKAHLEKLFTFLTNKGAENVDLDVDWHIVFKEEPSDRYIFVQEDLDQPTATAKVTNSVQLVDPDNGSNIPEGKFSVNLNTVKFGQTLSNSPRSKDFEITKKDNKDVTINKEASFRLYKAKWVSQGDHWKIANVENYDTYTVDEETGKIEFKNLQYEQTYLLFEEKAPEGYKRAIKPWLISLDKDGKVEVKKMGDDRAHVNKATGETVWYPTVDYNYLTDSTLASIEWPAGWFGRTGGGVVSNLVNEPDTPREIYKVNGNTLPRDENGNYVKPSSDAGITYLNGAEFTVYEASVRDNSNGGKIYKIEDMTLGEDDTELVLKSEAVNDRNGVISLPVSMNPTDYNTERYFLFVETTAPNGYASSNVAFGVALSRNGGTKQNLDGTAYAGDTRVYVVNAAVDIDSIAVGTDIECTEFKDVQVQAIPNYPEIEFSKVKGSEDNANNNKPTITTIPVKGAKFNLYKTKKVEGNFYVKDGDAIAALESKDGGKITLPYVASSTPGRTVYWLEETEAPEGYVTSDVPWLVDVDSNRTPRLIVRLADRKLYNDNGKKIYYGNPEGSGAAWYSLNGNAFNNKIHNVPEKTSRTARKVWSGGIAPSNITKIEFVLYSDIDGTSKPIQTKELTDWDSEVVFDNLLKYTDDGNGGLREIQYRIVENPVEGYVPSYDVNNDTGVTTVTNKKLTGGKVNLTIDKNWLDTSDSLKETVTVEIWSDKSGTKAFLQYAELKAPNWTVTIRDELPLYREDDSTKKVKYWVKEVGLDNFTQVDTTLSDGTIEAVDGASNIQNRHVYTAYKKPNPSLENNQWIAYFEYFVETPDGETEQVFCLSKDKTGPVTRSEGGNEGVKYKREEVVNINTFTGYITTSNGKISPSSALYYRLLKAIYLGAGANGSELLSDVNNDKHLLAHMTQFAIYEYTDFYWSGRNGSGKIFDYTQKGIENPGNEIGPFGLATEPIYRDGNHHMRIGIGVEEPYKDLMQGIEGTTNEYINTLGLKFYIYKPVKEDGKTIDSSRQYLIGVDSAAVNKYVHLNNRYTPSKITLYKHSWKETDENPMPLSGVSFDLYETDPTDHMSDETWLNTNKVNTSSYTTNGNGNVEISNLLVGKDYYLVERQTKNGYVKLSKPVLFTLSKTDGSDTQSWDDGTEGKITLKVGGSITTTTLKVANKELYDLPKSGGMGTYWFMIIGAMMMGFAVTAGFTRMNLLKLFRR